VGVAKRGKLPFHRVVFAYGPVRRANRAGAESFGDSLRRPLLDERTLNLIKQARRGKIAIRQSFLGDKLRFYESLLAARPRRWTAVAGVVLLVTVAYLPALHAGFVWDDDSYVTGNDTLRSAGGLASIWLEPSLSPQYYPVVFTSFWCEYNLWRLRSAGYHAVNLCLHLLTAALVWGVLRRLEVFGAGLAAALFALHPVSVESVAWITERKNVLSAVFCTASALAYLHFDPPDRPGAARDPRSYALACVLFLLALLSKSVTASLPVVLAVAYWWHGGGVSLRRLTPLLPLLVLGASLGLYTSWLETTQVGASGGEWELSPVGRVLVAGRALAFYAGKLLWPVKLCFIYPRWEIDPGSAWQYAYPLAVLAVLAVLFLALSHIGRAPLASLLCFGITLFPALGFLNVYPQRYSWVADHFQYLASIPPLTLAAAGLTRVGTAWPVSVRASAAAALLCLLALLTFRQSEVYRDSETLWRKTLECNPDCFLAHTNLGNLLLRRGEVNAALSHYRASVAIRPDDFVSATDLAWLLATGPEGVRSPAEAVALAERASTATQYGFAQALETLAAAYAGVGRFDDAVRMAERGLRIARLAGDRKAERDLESELELYRAHRPYLLPEAKDAKTPKE
jgi:tetratricopeptide (TPR) repeat protein